VGATHTCSRRYLKGRDRWLLAQRRVCCSAARCRSSLVLLCVDANHAQRAAAELGEVQRPSSARTAAEAQSNVRLSSCVRATRAGGTDGHFAAAAGSAAAARHKQLRPGAPKRWVVVRAFACLLRALACFRVFASGHCYRMSGVQLRAVRGVVAAYSSGRQLGLLI
jgi:hypothetical protein